MWKITPEEEREIYGVFQYSDKIVVCPVTDTKPHNVDGYTCKCEIRVEMDNGHPLVIHTRYTETAALKKSMKKLFG